MVIISVIKTTKQNENNKKQVESKDPPSENKQKQTANSIILPHITTC